MADRRDTNRLLVVGDLVDDAIGADAQRAEAVQPAPQCMSDVRVPLEQSERVLDGVDQRPVEVEKLLPGAPRENDFGHASAVGSTLAEVPANLVKRDTVASCQLVEASFDGGKRGRVREDFRGL